MPRKKKSEVKKENKNISSIGYQGKVKVEIKNGKSVVSSKEYHNHGTKKMFEFICNALAGNFHSDQRPWQIKLFTVIGDPKKSDEKADDYTTWKFTNNTSISPYLPFAITPVVSSIGAETASVTYSFRIPYLFITADPGVKLYKIALYSSSASEEKPDTDKMALFGFVGKDEKSGKMVWDPIELNTDIADGANYSINIEWTITISNLTEA